MANDLTKEPTQQNLFEVCGDSSALQQYLGIHPPDNASKASPILAFRRKREVEIPWGEIITDDALADAGAEAIAAIRGYFEKSWGFDVNNEEWWKDESHHLLDTENGSWCVKQLGKAPSFHVFRPDFDNPDPKGLPTALPINEGFIIRHGTSGRLYLLDNPQKTLSEEPFRSFNKYESAWQEIDGVELVFESEVDAQSYYMDFEEIDLRPVLIQRKYEELRILRDFARKVKDNVAGVTEK
ncbi:MAG: hypothetical protein GY867_07225, partial [bacterium]|nr:hypothetical protein [bacterium]